MKEQQQGTSVQQRWLTEKEVSQMTGISLSSLRKYRIRGVHLPYSKVGKSVRYAIADVVSFMDAHRVMPCR